MRRIIFLSLFISTTVFSQSKDILYTKSKEHYDKKEFREAFYFLTRLINIDSSNAEVYKWRGNCFYEFNELDSAKSDYLRALSLSDKYPENYYNLANVYAQQQDPKMEEQHLLSFLQHKPNDADALLRVYHCLQRRKSDSASYFIEQAYKADSLNEWVYNSYAWHLYVKNEMTRTLRMAENARTLFPLTNELLPLECYVNFSMRNFAKTIALTDSLITKFPDDISFYILQLKSEILLKTNSEKYTLKRNKLQLADCSTNKIQLLDSLVSSTGSPYQYSTLLEKFRNNTDSMSLDDFFLAYYGYTTDARYSPYGQSSSMLSTLSKDSSPEEVLSTYQTILKADEFNLDIYEQLAFFYFENDKPKFKSALKKYIGLMEGTLATGTGTSADSGYIVISPRHEYSLIAYMGMKSSMQSLRHVNSHSFDVLTVVDENENKQEIYFNIDKPWRSLSDQFSKTSGKRDKKGRRKKR
jgi:tetratricopeptide (TPR) repeat protein